METKNCAEFSGHHECLKTISNPVRFFLVFLINKDTKKWKLGKAKKKTNLESDPFVNSSKILDWLKWDLNSVCQYKRSHY